LEWNDEIHLPSQIQKLMTALAAIFSNENQQVANEFASSSSQCFLPFSGQSCFSFLMVDK
jgi:hypothetical protein